jgi:hypothetical protein
VRLRARLSALATVVGVGLAALSASAEEQISAEKPEKDAISPYEQQSIVDALHETHTRAEPAPEGKLIEEIVFLRRDVIDARDPLPDLLNTFHWRSQERTIRRQMLFSPGDRYQQELIDETARNLRQLRQLSLVLLIPVQGSTPSAFVCSSSRRTCGACGSTPTSASRAGASSTSSSSRARTTSSACTTWRADSS